MQIINCKYIFSEQEIAQIINWYNEPQSLSWIAKKFGIKNRGVIKRVLLENNIVLRNKEEIIKLNVRNCKQACLDKYGVENVFQLDEVKRKIEQTCLERYGVRNVCQSPEIRARTVKTCQERYGTTNGG